MSACQACGCRTENAFLCAKDALTLRTTLAQLPARIRDLETAATKQARIDQAPTGHRPPPPEDEIADAEEASIPAYLRGRMGRITLPATALPISLGAATLHSQAVMAVNTWAHHIARTHRLPIRGRVTRTLIVYRNRIDWQQHVAPIDVPGLCAWLIAVMDAVRVDEAAGEMFRSMLDLSATIDATVDRRDCDLFAGPCDKPDVRVDFDLLAGPTCAPFDCAHETCGQIRGGVYRLAPRPATCGADLFAAMGEATVTCRVCGAEYVFADRKRHFEDKIDEQWARPQAIANALTTLDEPVNASTLRTWIERDAKLTRPVSYPLIRQVGIDDEGKPLFRVGDVRARIVAMLVAKAERMSA